jgi:hypothetical protein
MENLGRTKSIYDMKKALILWALFRHLFLLLDLQFLDFYGSNEQTPKMIFFVFVFVTQILRQFLHADDGNE